MGFDGSGNYTRTNGTLSGSTLWAQRAAQANPIISATEHDAEMNDVATALTDCVKANGSKAATGNQPMAGFKHTGVGDATASNQYAAFGQLTNSTVQFDSIAGTAASPGYVSGDDTDTGVFSPAANTWALATAGVERLRVNGTGEVSLTNPTAILHVGSAATSTQDCSVSVGEGRAASGNAYVDLVGDTTYTDYGCRIIRNGGANGNSEILHRGTGNLTLSAPDGGVLNMSLGGNVFSLSPLNGLQVVDENNNVGGFITTSKQAGSANKLRIFGSRGSGGIVLRTDNAGTIADRIDVVDAGDLQPVTDNANTCGASGKRWSAIWAANGTIQTSDERTKKDIADSSLGLAFVKALRPVSYKWVEGSKEVTGQVDGQAPTTVSVPGQRTHFGLIAQEVKAAIPEGVDFGGWVLTDKNDPTSQQALRYDQFIAPLIQAVKELSAKVESLEAKIAVLEGV
jgi:hypothetical protein